MNWHTLTTDQVLAKTASSPDGLSSIEVEKRLAEHGANQIEQRRKKSAAAMFLEQFTDFMIIVLIGAAVISGIIGELTDTIAIVVIVVLNAIIGFVQQFRAEKAMEALKRMAAPSALVCRGKTTQEIPSSQVVPGDIVLLEAGRVVPADIRLIESQQLKCSEAVITGESIPVTKTTVPLKSQDLPIGDRENMVFKGTTVSYGRGCGVVIATGMNTELGKIASMIQTAEEVKTPLQKRLAAFGRHLAVAVLVICGIVFLTGLIRGEEPLLMLLTAISLAVAAIPEALPAVVTISLALGARKLVSQNALIRKLPAVETLGSVTYICSDKTGTLTMNKMTAEEFYINKTVYSRADLLSAINSKTNPHRHDPLYRFIQAMALSTDASRNEQGEGIGDPTELALYDAAHHAGFEKKELEQILPRVAEIPFDSSRKLMTTFHEQTENGKSADRYISFTKGAVDIMLERCRAVLTADGEAAVNKEEIISQNNRMTSQGMRVLAVGIRAWKTLPEERVPQHVETDLLFCGLIGMIDPPRPEVREAVALCKTAGIRPVMITGDHPGTAKAIAQRLGIIQTDNDMTLTGPQLAELSQQEFENIVEQVRVYARVAPEQKLKVLKALQDKGQFAAMTGDGVNDAPALKRADIGIAMGITGTDVSKEASHMILLDDNFATIVSTVREGRRIFDNIRKFIRYTMTSNSGEIWTIFLAPLLGLPIPLLPIHILWINLVTDGLPGLALAAEPAEKGIMNRPPRHPRESIFAHGLGVQIIWIGLLMGGVSVLTQFLAINRGLQHWRTMVFTVLCFSQMGNVLAIRSEKQSLFSLGLFSNKPLFGAFILTVLLQLATVYVPFLNPVFKTHPLNAVELALTIGFSTIVFFAVEIDKAVRRRKRT